MSIFLANHPFLDFFQCRKSQANSQATIFASESGLDLFGVGRNVDGVDVRVEREERHRLHYDGHFVRQSSKYFLSVVGGGAVAEKVAAAVVAAADSQRPQPGLLVGDGVLRGSLISEENLNSIGQL